MGVKVKRKARFVSPWSQRGSESGLRVKVTSDKQGGDDGVKKKDMEAIFSDIPLSSAFPPRHTPLRTPTPIP